MVVFRRDNRDWTNYVEETATTNLLTSAFYVSENTLETKAEIVAQNDRAYASEIFTFCDGTSQTFDVNNTQIYPISTDACLLSSLEYDGKARIRSHMVGNGNTSGTTTGTAKKIYTFNVLPFLKMGLSTIEYKYRYNLVSSDIFPVSASLKIYENNQLKINEFYNSGPPTTILGKYDLAVSELTTLKLEFTAAISCIYTTIATGYTDIDIYYIRIT